ncbi:MAG: HAMP domain-containing sensor histidine kinase [Gemmatimonadota bacterium]|nr:HAMP domain-containing sensor histidine kinase [Gemmatimonadota bacterium]
MLLWAGWWLATIAVTAALRLTRGNVDFAHVELLYLMLVLGASATGGGALGGALAAYSVASIDFFFQEPYDRVTIDKRVDLSLLVTFLVTAMVATALLTRARRQAAVARRSAAEARRFAEEAARAEAAADAARLKELTLAAMSHDLRTPLTSIAAHAQSLAAAGNAAGRTIAEQAALLSRLVEDALGFAEADIAGRAPDAEVNATEDVIGALTRQTKGVLDGKHLVVDLGAQDQPLLGTFDFVQTLRILTNLVENALRYTPEGGVVHLDVVSRDGWLEFSVADRGPGIAPSEAEAVFTPFYRSGSTLAGRSGLGLAVARRLATVQGGTLIHAPRAGGGTVFTLRLPAAAASVAAAANDE